MSVAVVIPMRDEAHTIRQTLDDLLDQSRRPDQIVLVDAGSKDGTRAVVEGHPIGAIVPLRVVPAGPAYPGRARNLGVLATSSEWIAFTDAGVRLSPAWLAALVKAAESTPDADAIAGDWDVEVPTLFTECVALASATQPERAGGGAMRPPSVCSLLLRRDAWDQVGRFREDLRSAEDLLFLRRLHTLGPVVRAPGRHAHWLPPDTLHATWRRFRIYARHNIRAGLFGQWQGPLLLRYAIVVAGAVAASAWTPLSGWLVALSLLGLLLVARSAKAVYANRGVYPGGASRKVLRLTLLVPLIGLIDGATAVGTLDWLVRDAFSGT